MRSSAVIRRTTHARRDEETTDSDNVIVVNNIPDPPRRRKKRLRRSFPSVSHLLRPNGSFLVIVVLSIISLVSLLTFFNERNTNQRKTLVFVGLRPTLPIHGKGRIQSPIEMSTSSDDGSDRNQPDFGGLILFDDKDDSSYGAEIKYGPDDKFLERFRPKDDKTLKRRGSFDWYYYQFDDDENRNPMHGYRDESLAQTKHCRRVSWHRDIYPNCNEFHQLDTPKLAMQDGVNYIGGGSYRNVFSIDQHNSDPEMALKVAEMSLDYDIRDYEFMRMEGSVNEAIGPHPLIVDMYGFCALSLVIEAMKGGDAETPATPKYNREKCKQTPKMDGPDLVEMNGLKPNTKLEWALEMAEAVALLHNHARGVIVHDDIQLSQFLISPRGHIKMGDFNRAEFMLYDEEHEEYCRYRNGEGHGDWRSPEEYHDEPLNEKIDVWSLGMNFYAILTGLSPMHDVCKDEKAAERVKHGELPFFHPKWEEKSFAEAQLVGIIKDCLEYDPDKRMSITELVSRIRAAVAENRRRENQRH